MNSLLIIDTQNDYLDDGRFPLWNMPTTLENIKQQIALAKETGDKIIFIQHIGSASAPFFAENTKGAELIEEIYHLAPDSLIIQKRQGDSFIGTNLLEVLNQNQIKEINICGMMTQNCVLFTAITAKQKGFAVNILANSCTSVSTIIHNVALNGLRNLVSVI